MAGSVGVSLGTPASRIIFAEGGSYTLSFTAQTSSTSGSTVNFWFWPRINGVDITDSGMQNTLHQNGATMIVSRTQIFTVAANDYLEVNYMVDSTSGFLNYTAASSPVPTIPSSTLAITRTHG